MEHSSQFFCVVLLSWCLASVACSHREELQPLPIQHLGKPPQHEIPASHFLGFLNSLKGLQGDGAQVFHRFETISRLLFLQDMPITITGGKLWKNQDIFKQTWTIRNFYDSLPGEAQQPHQIYFGLQVTDEENKLSWHSTPYPNAKDFGHTVGSLQSKPSPTEDIFDIAAQVKIQLTDISPGMLLRMLQSFIFYWTNLVPQHDYKSATWEKIAAQFAHLSAREKQMLARFSEDMPKTFAYFCKYISLQDILGTPEVKDDRLYFALRLQPVMERLEEDYPDFASKLRETKDRLQIVMTLLAAADRRIIGQLVWENAEMTLCFSLPTHLKNEPGNTILDELLPRQTISQIDLSFSYLGSSLEIKGIELDNCWAADAQALSWESRISRMPAKLEISGFFGLIYDLFATGPSLHVVFQNLTAMNHGKGSGMCLRLGHPDDQKILQMEVAGRFPADYVVRHAGKGFFHFLFPTNPKRDFFAFRHDLYRQFFQDYLACRDK